MAVVIEREGKTVSEATINACEELGVPRTEIDVEILNEGSSGVLGIGGKNARVKISLKNSNFSVKGLRAKKALGDLLNYLADSHSVNIKETHDKIKLDVTMSDDKGLIIGKRGEMIKAMEYIVGKIASRSCDDGREKRVSIDVDGYKKRREDTVSRLVRETINKVKETGQAVTLDRLSASERRLVYIKLKRERGIQFETKLGQNDFKSIKIRKSG